MSFPGRPFYPSNRGEFLLLVACVAVSVTLMSLPTDKRDEVAGYLKRITSAPTERVAAFTRDVADLQRRNMEQGKRILELELQAEAARRMVEDAGRQAGPALDPGYAGDMVACRIVQRQWVSRTATSIMIRSMEPVDWRPYQPVVSSSGYLGRLRTILNDREAWVELMTSPDFALGVEIEGTGLLGVLRPRGNEFILDYVGLQEEVESGQRVITSGIDEVEKDGSGVALTGTPRGFLVGTVEYAYNQDNEVVKEIIVAPAAPLTANETVYVVVPVAQGAYSGREGPW